MSQQVTVSPLTRIEGHLAIKTEVADGKVTQAWTSGEMFRGFENILRSRDPLDAQQITQRICGVCSVEHGMASILAQDMAYGVSPPDNGRIVRNLIHAASFIMSHITHFYLLSALDFIDVAAVAGYQGKDPALASLKAWVLQEQSNRSVLPAGPFLPRYAAEYARDNDLNLGALKHYLEAFDLRQAAHRMCALFSGKVPHAPALIPGGVTDMASAWKIASYGSILERLKRFIENAYLPDVLGVAQAFPAYFSLGKSGGNYLAFGVFPESAGGNPFLSSGAVMDGKWSALNSDAIAEDVGCSYFSSPTGLKPDAGETTAAPDKPGAYSWLKAPRYHGRPMEVGPLARLMVTCFENRNPVVVSAVESLLKSLNRPMADLNSVMGRHAARALECLLIANRCGLWLSQLQPDKPVFADFAIPEATQGRGLTEAARGALGHWIQVQGRKIANYQCVVPTTWNASPRDDRGTPGPIEQALAGTPVADTENPVEAARVVRSFDPCIACAVH